jgi:predicted dehydrogenase
LTAVAGGSHTGSKESGEVAIATRIGVIGCGFYAPNHLNAWAALGHEGAELAAVCDRDRASAERAGHAFGVPAYTDAAAMLDAEGLDLVDIVTRHETHRALAELSIGRGVATIVQKPFAPSFEEAAAIVDAAEAAGVWLAVHENFRYAAPMRNIARIVASGAIGTPTWGRIAFRTHYDVYRTQPYFYDEERFAIADVGIHVLDVARYLLGEVARISCETQRRNPKVRAEDTATMLLRHESGAASVVECSYEARRNPDPFPETMVELEGDRGSIVTLPGCRARVTCENLVWEEDIGAALLPWTTRPWHVSQEGAFGACRHFLAAFRAGMPAETSGADNLRSFALVDAAYRAAETGAAIAPRRHRAR